MQSDKDFGKGADSTSSVSEALTVKQLA